MSDWDEALGAFLASRRSENTRRAYAFAVLDLVGMAKKGLGEMRKRDIAGWVNGLRAAGLAETTIGQRLAAVSSFYDYAADVYELDTPNPARGKSLRGLRITAYANAVWLTAEQSAALLGVIDRNYARGKRDYALFLGYLLLGWRNTEWRTVKVMDVAGGNTHWRGKGKKEGMGKMPALLGDALQDHLGAMAQKLAGRNAIGSAYVFPGQDGRRPISAEQVRNLLRKYVALAGIDCPGIHVHSLRHTAAMLRKEAGEDVDAIRDFLNHSSVNTTQIYLHRIDRGNESGFVKVGQLLGLG